MRRRRRKGRRKRWRRRERRRKREKRKEERGLLPLGLREIFVEEERSNVVTL